MATIQEVIVGQDEIIRGVIICLLAGGHGLLEGVPGLGKTLLIRTMASALDLTFARIQFTPDLMPADIVGTSSWSTPLAAAASSSTSRGRSSTTSSSPTRSTGRPRRPSRRSSRRWPRAR
ncbi:MAG: MoxR family ATPase [Nannocystaceae bacterium]